jgi:hypothetical protein
MGKPVSPRYRWQPPSQTLTVLNVNPLALLLPLMVIQYLRHSLPLFLSTLNEPELQRPIVVSGLSLLLRGINLATASAHIQDVISAALTSLLKYTKWIDISYILPTGRKGTKSPTGTLIPV